MAHVGQVARWRGREYAIVGTCEICASPVGVAVVGPDQEVPEPEYSCPCRRIHPERFRVPGEHGYRVKQPARFVEVALS